MYHLRLKGSHYEMGRKRGLLFKKNHISFPLRLDDFQLRHGAESEGLLRTFFPEICQEIQGVCDSTGADYLPFVSWMLCMGCCMYNLNQNIPMEIRGCTAFAYSTEKGQVVYGRNNDLPPFLRDGCKSELYTPRNGHRFIIQTSSFINGEEGLNEHGLAVAMTFVMTDLEKIRPGFNSCFIVRYLLEKAKDADEAIFLLQKLPVASNCNILVADKSGRMAVAECSPFVSQLRTPEPLGTGRIVCTVNSFTSDSMRPYDDARGNDFRSLERFQTVMNAFPRYFKGNFIETTQRLLKGEYGFLCQYDDEPDFETVWSSVFDLKSLAVYRAEGDPRKKKFRPDLRLQK